MDALKSAKCDLLAEITAEGEKRVVPAREWMAPEFILDQASIFDMIG